MTSYFSGRPIAVTGAAHGIGRELALQLASRGATLGLADHEEVALAATADACRSRGAAVLAIPVDVADAVAVNDFAEQFSAFAGHAEGVFAVAGMLYSGTVADTPAEDFARVIDSNLLGVLHVVQAFAQHVRAADSGHIVTVSSAFGLVTAAGYSAYSASKAGVLALSDALRMELRDSGTSVTCAIPGGVRTGIARRAGTAPGVDHAAFVRSFTEHVARTPATTAAALILRGVQRHRCTVYVGADARAAAVLSKFGTAATNFVLGRLFA
ncbi:SDR family NAD(P)-dependent oxidoreductase [Tomitella gaofuii]|uniref:SDR family NAD(P)-dependent oxidoreductase n=1 Tax=Tomitella gaofuii TaxID=2760083 RepID=UPI0015FA89FF